MDDRLSFELLAIGVAHAVYRNTEVENFHVKGRIMDQSLYDDVYKIVSEKANTLIKSMHFLIYTHQNGLLTILDFQNVSEEEMDFLQDVIFGIQCGCNWDLPSRIEMRVGNDVATFLLSGEFKKHCDGIHIFDDAVMKPINKDIVDRTYCILKHYADRS